MSATAWRERQLNARLSVRCRVFVLVTCFFLFPRDIHELHLLCSQFKKGHTNPSFSRAGRSLDTPSVDSGEMYESVRLPLHNVVMGTASVCCANFVAHSGTIVHSVYGQEQTKQIDKNKVALKKKCEPS